MQTFLARHPKLIRTMALVAALGCGGDNGPHPSVTLSIRGQVLTIDPTPLPVAGATVRLLERWGYPPISRAHSTTDQAGRYQLSYTFTSICQPSDETSLFIEASADKYETALTLSSDPEHFSDPPIYCATEPQVIDLSLQPFGALQLITITGGSSLDPEGYTLLVDGLVPPYSVAYGMGPNAEQVISEVLPGQYSLELTEVAGNCTVAGDNPRTVAVAARDTTVATFHVTCAS
jgi:hypothetical protein